MVSANIELSSKSLAVLRLIADGFSYTQILDHYPEMSFKDIFNAAQEALDLIEGKNEKSTSLDKIRETHKRAYEAWTSAEDEKLKELVESGEKVKAIAEYLQRQTGSIQSRIRKLGLNDDMGAEVISPSDILRPQQSLNEQEKGIYRKGEEWTTEEEEFLFEKLRSGESVSKIAKDLRRTVGAVTLRIAKSRNSQAGPSRELGKHPKTGVPVLLQQGRFGPFIRHRYTNVSIPITIHPSEVTLEKALMLLNDKESKPH